MSDSPPQFRQIFTLLYKLLQFWEVVLKTGQSQVRNTRIYWQTKTWCTSDPLGARCSLMGGIREDWVKIFLMLTGIFELRHFDVSYLKFKVSSQNLFWKVEMDIGLKNKL